MAQDHIIAYRAQARREADGPWAKLSDKIAAKPILAGALGGTIAVALALVRGWRGALNEPLSATILGLLVILIWTLLFWVMRPFFARQLHYEVEVTRGLLYTGGLFQWTEGEKILREIHSPTFRLLCEPVPAQKRKGAQENDASWPAWLVIAGRDGQLIIETRLDIVEAATRPSAPDDIASRAEEKLPTHILSPLLQIARGLANDEEE